MTKQFSFTQRPPKQQGRAEFWKIYRAKPTTPITGIILSDDITGAMLHWLNRSSCPHTEPAEHCVGCQAGVSMRWEGYLHCWHPTTNTHFIAAFPGGPADTIDAWREKCSTLRGTKLVLAKPGGKQQSRVIAQLSDSKHAHNALPPAADIAKVLAHLWGLDRAADVRISAEHFVERGHADEDIPEALRHFLPAHRAGKESA